MKKLMIIFLACLCINSSVEACVTYHLENGTYTVDKSGCVDF
jgi:hypothetical protein